MIEPELSRRLMDVPTLFDQFIQAGFYLRGWSPKTAVIYGVHSRASNKPCVAVALTATTTKSSSRSPNSKPGLSACASADVGGGLQHLHPGHECVRPVAGGTALHDRAQPSVAALRRASRPLRHSAGLRPPSSGSDTLGPKWSGRTRPDD
jgi:hypothetical protein